MSAYIDFYVKRNNVYVPIGDFSRSNPIYQVMSDFIGWEKIVHFDEKLYNDVISRFNDKIANYKEMKADYENKINLIKTMEAPLNEKMEFIHDYQESIHEIDDEIEMYRLATMASLLSRDDVIVVASASSLYGL